MVSRVQQLAVGYPEGRLELQLVGGFTDPHRYSDELFANIMCKQADVRILIFRYLQINLKVNCNIGPTEFIQLKAAKQE